MKNIFKNSKRGIAAILTLCILLGLAGTCVYAASIPKGNTALAEETTQELMPMMACGCGDNDYIDYDGRTFNSTSQGLNEMGIPFSGSGLGIVLLSSMLDINFSQCGTDLCVYNG